MGRRTICIIGAGNAGYALAAELTLSGYEVILYEDPEFEENLSPIRKAGGIELSGIGKNGFAQIKKLTTKIDEAIRDAELVIIATQALAHETVVEKCVPHVKDGQIFVFLPGYYGSILLPKAMKERGSNRTIAVGESRTLLYGCSRVIGEAKANIQLISESHIAALPADYTQSVVDIMNELFPGRFHPAKNVLEIALNAAGLFQTAMSIMSASWIEAGGPFYHFKQGYSKSVMKVLEILWQEKKAILDSLDLSDIFPYTKLSELVLNSTKDQLTIQRPDSLQHRFVSENCPFRLVPMASLGDLLGISAPVTKALIVLASAINGVNYFKEGRTMEKLGLGGLSIRELKEFFG